MSAYAPPLIQIAQTVESSLGSMPLGNGDIGVNVWVDHEGDLIFYVAKTDAWSEIERLLKVGRLRMPGFRERVKKDYSQTLNLKNGVFEASAGAKGDRMNVRIWVDAHHPVVRVEWDSDQSFKASARLDLWRDAKRELQGVELHSAMHLINGNYPAVEEPDTVMPSPESNSVAWCHHNVSSIWPLTMDLQGLGNLKENFDDPLLGLTFGGMAGGPGWKSLDDRQIES